MDIQKMDVWSLVTHGYFEGACKKSDTEYTQTQSMFSFRNKVYALFHLRKFDEAVSLTKQLIEFRNGDTYADFIFCGIAKWILNETEEAILLENSKEKYLQGCFRWD